ncbi:MAG: hypothetical protein HY744_03725 [Deltaproteobacteria bacterium]|nr:hypothetical protein [Deltaproteobacteria bacterium]
MGQPTPDQPGSSDTNSEPRRGGSVLGRLAARALDRAFVAMVRAQGVRGRRRNRAESLGHERRVALLGTLARRIDERLAGSGGEIFRSPQPIAPEAASVRALPDGGAVQDITWPSDYHAWLPEIDERYRRHTENLRGAARLLLHAEPRPAAILLHGYMAGQYRVEERMWPVSWLYRSGLDLALFVLPLHGVRAIRGRSGPPPFPSSDPRFTNEGFRHAVGDLRDLCLWLRERGHPAVGLMGMSLGGYTTALAATVEAQLAFAVPMIPLGALADFARDQGRLGSDPAQAAEEHRCLDAVHRVVSPLHRPPVVAPERMLVVAGELDGVTPLRHARRLAAHFGAPLEIFPGGHLLQLGRGASFRRVRNMLQGLEVLPR